MLQRLEDEFKIGIQQVKKAKEEIGIAKYKIDKIMHIVHVPQRGHDKWEQIRSECIGDIACTHYTPHNTPVHTEGTHSKEKKGYKIDLKEGATYFHIVDRHMIVITDKGVCKIYKIGTAYTLTLVWECAHSLYLYLYRTNALSASVMQVLSSILVMLYRKKVRSIDRVYQQFVLFVRAHTAKHAYFVNGYVCFVYPFGDMLLFDESLREILLGANKARIMNSVINDKAECASTINEYVKKHTEVHIHGATVRVTKEHIRITYPNKSIYEEIHVKNIVQIVCCNGVLYGMDGTFVHVILVDK